MGNAAKAASGQSQCQQEKPFKKGGRVTPALTKAMEKSYPKGATIIPKKGGKCCGKN